MKWWARWLLVWAGCFAGGIIIGYYGTRLLIIVWP